MAPRSAHLLLLAGVGVHIAAGCGKDDTGDPADCDTPTSYLLDVDGDGFGNNANTTDACSLPDGYAEIGGDCDDEDPAVNPDAQEVCDELDNDCDGSVDVEATDGTTYYTDADSDGFGDDDSAVVGCEALAGWTTADGDCDDGDDAVHPDAEELCDAIDNDCDGLVDGDDDEVPDQSWYIDADADGYGVSSGDITAACAGDGYALEDGDCDDADATINPGAGETWYDGVDQDCDGRSDYDQDGDRYTSDAFTGSDCDDTDETVNPAAEDTWYDGVDQDCDGSSDYDQDGDGYDHEDYGDPADGLDCDDEDPEIHPDQADDDGDGVDDDCSGVADEDISLGDADAVHEGVDSGDQVGENLAGFGDINGDGFDDFAVGAPQHDGGGGSGAGAVYVLLGSGTVSTGRLDTAHVIIDHSDAAALLGASVAFVGDVDGDSYDDLLMGAPGAGRLVSGAGDAYLFLGGSDMSGVAFSELDADHTFSGTASGSSTGSAVAGVGDMTGDGLADLLVSAPGHTVRRGVTYLVSAPTLGVSSLDDATHSWIGEDADDYAGSALASAGDVDGDGTEDLLFGSYINDRGGAEAGSAYLVHGPGTSISDLEDADAIVVGESSGDWAAYALDGAGDTNGDGYDDVIIGAHKHYSSYSSAGAAYLMLGPISGEVDLSRADASFDGPNQNAFLGYGLSGVGDADADGNDDFMLGAYGENSHGNGTGAAYLVLGPVSGSYSLESDAIKATGETSGNYAGVGVQGAGDLDGDGTADLLVGARGAGGNTGLIYVLLGPWL